MDWKERFSPDPAIRNGKPCVLATSKRSMTRNRQSHHGGSANSAAAARACAALHIRGQRTCSTLLRSRRRHLATRSARASCPDLELDECLRPVLRFASQRVREVTAVSGRVRIWVRRAATLLPSLLTPALGLTSARHSSTLEDERPVGRAANAAAPRPRRRPEPPPAALPPAGRAGDQRRGVRPALPRAAGARAGIRPRAAGLADAAAWARRPRRASRRRSIACRCCRSTTR